MAITIGNSPKIWINTPTSRKEYDIYLIPAQSGSTNLTMTVTVPYANIKYFFDNIQLCFIQRGAGITLFAAPALTLCQVAHKLRFHHIITD